MNEQDPDWEDVERVTRESEKRAENSACAAFAGAVSVPCNGVWNMGNSTDSGVIGLCALNKEYFGGSTVLTHNDYYCVKNLGFQHPWQYHIIRIALLKGPHCEAWLPGDYCYSAWGATSCDYLVYEGYGFNMGDPNGKRLYFNYYSYLNAYSDSNHDLYYNPQGLLYNASIQTFGK